MKRYKITFEYVSPFGDHRWEEAMRESGDLEGLKQQLEGQATMNDVRNSRLWEQEVQPWVPIHQSLTSDRMTQDCG